MRFCVRKISRPCEFQKRPGIFARSAGRRILQVEICAWNICGAFLETEFIEFGEYFQDLVLVNLPPGVEKSTRQAVIYVKEQINSDYTLIYAWFRGKIEGRKSLSIWILKELLRHFLGKPGLKTLATVQHWISLGPPKYLVILDDPQFKLWLHERQIAVGNPIYRSEQVRRTGLHNQIRERLVKRQGRSLILHGPPGVGKTSLLETLYHYPLLQARFEQTFWLVGQSDRTLLCANALSKIAVGLGIPVTDPGELLAQIGRKIGTQRLLFYVDALHHIDQLEGLLSILSPASLLIATTRSSRVLLAAEANSVLSIPPFRWEDALKYAHLTCGESAISAEHLREISELVRYNPLGLRLALKNAAQFCPEVTIAQLKRDDQNLATDVERELTRPLQLGYEMLEVSLSWAFRQLAKAPYRSDYTLPELAELWNVSETQALSWAASLSTDAGLLQPANQADWHLHQSVYNFSRNLSSVKTGHRLRSVYRWKKRHPR